MSRLSRDDSMSYKERKRFYEKVILPAKNKIDPAARNIQPETHEFMNASSTTTFGMKTALGLTEMERVAEGVNDTEITIDKLIIRMRIPTKEYLCRPQKIKDLTPKQKSLFYDSDSGYDSDEDEQHVFQGHIGSATAGRPKKGRKQYIVTRESASRSGFHTEQLAAQEQSTHHLSLSYRLSKITDAHQLRGRHVIRAYNDGGFHPNSFFNEYHIKNGKDAAKIALMAEYYYKKRQTQEKNFRKRYEEPDDLSESYSEISSDSEVYSTDSNVSDSGFNEFKARKKKEEPFKAFLKQI